MQNRKIYKSVLLKIKNNNQNYKKIQKRLSAIGKPGLRT
jgi:hypothetical protein